MEYNFIDDKLNLPLYSKELIDTFHKCLESPDKRYKNCFDIINDLEKLNDKINILSKRNKLLVLMYKSDYFKKEYSYLYSVNEILNRLNAPNEQNTNFSNFLPKVETMPSSSYQNFNNNTLRRNLIDKEISFNGNNCDNSSRDEFEKNCEYLKYLKIDKPVSQPSKQSDNNKLIEKLISEIVAPEIPPKAESVKIPLIETKTKITDSDNITLRSIIAKTNKRNNATENNSVRDSLNIPNKASSKNNVSLRSVINKLEADTLSGPFINTFDQSYDIVSGKPSQI